jgi:hypothetical protein
MQRSSWVVSAVVFAASLAACSPDVGQVTNPPLVTIQFDPAATPAVVPQPNNLAIDPNTGLINVPSNPGDTPTQTAFNETYLDTLDGFPMESGASVTTSGDLNPSTLGTGVLVLDITNPAAAVPVTVTASYVSGGADAGGTLNIPGPLAGGQWQRGHTYAAVVIGGNQPGAVSGANGQAVTGSSTWALVSSAANCTSVTSCGAPIPLCALPDGGAGGPNSGCLSTTDLIPSQADAVQLQELQTGYAPLLQALSSAPFNIPRSNVAILWTFSITTQAEVTFDPANTVIPFPNDVVRTGAGGLVTLPVPPGTPAVLAELIAGLNTLNGFSTTATIVSAVDFSLPNDGVSALMQGSLDPLSISPPLAIGFAAEGASVGAAASQGAPSVSYCLSDVGAGCPSVTATLPDGGVKPQVLGIVPNVPLDELTTYAAYMTNALRDVTGKPVIPSAIFALVRLPYTTAPLAADNGTGKSQVSLLTDSQAQQLYQLQKGLAPLLTGLEQQGIPYTKVVQAWGFRTQSAVSDLQALASAPYAPGGPPSTPISFRDVTTTFGPAIPNFPAGAKVFVGEIIDLFALTAPTATFAPGLEGAQGRPIPFLMVTPNPSTVPTAGFPSTIFGHGLGGNRTNMLAIATAFASSGRVGIAIDEPWHGARNTCLGFGAISGLTDAALCVLPGAGTASCGSSMVGPNLLTGRCLADAAHRAACAPSVTDPLGDIGCTLIGQGDCDQSTATCEGAGFYGDGTTPSPIPDASGWNLLNLANLFATRDNFRQQVISHAQLARIISDRTAGTSLSALTVKLDPTRIDYAGQSLGGILGTLFTSVAFNVNNAGLNVAGGDPVNILLTSPAFSSLLTGFQAGLAEAGIITNTPTYDLFIDISRWILDPADPVNAGYYTVNPTGISSPFGPSIPADRRAFVQWIVGDQVVPNPTTLQLIQAALHDPTATGIKVPGTGPFFGYQFNDTSTPYSFVLANIPACNRHPFLLEPPGATCGTVGGNPSPGLTLTQDAQTQLVTFLSGVAPY